MKRFILILGSVSSIIFFLFVADDVPGFAGENEPVTEKEVKITLIFSENGKWEPEDKGMGNDPDKEPDKWVKISEESSPKGDVLFDDTITIRKLNPCTVCGPGGCYVKQNC